MTTFSHTYPWLSVILFLHLIIYLLEAVGFLTLGDSSPFGLTKSDMTALQSCFGFPSSVTVNSTIFFPPPPGSTCYGKVSFDCSLPYLKMIVGLFCTSFFFFYWVFLCYVCLISSPVYLHSSKFAVCKPPLPYFSRYPYLRQLSQT